jgi:hypothetical protein
MKTWLIILLFLVLIGILAFCAWTIPSPSSQPVQIKGGNHVYPVQVVGSAPRPSQPKPASEPPDTVAPAEHPVEPAESIHVGGIR